MKLTRKQAIEISISLWTWLAETGERFKYVWPGWKKYGRMYCDCALCEYDNDKRCKACPYYKRFGSCQAQVGSDEPTLFDEWCDAETKKDRKKYARLFLEQLQSLKEDTK